MVTRQSPFENPAQVAFMAKPDIAGAVALLGPSFPYYPRLSEVLGITESIFLCRLIWWTPKSKDADGWVYKDSAELAEETGLNYDQQFRIRRNLKAAGILEERHSRLEHRIYFRVNTDVLNSKFADGHLAKTQVGQFEEVQGGDLEEVQGGETLKHGFDKEQKVFTTSKTTVMTNNDESLESVKTKTTSKPHSDGDFKNFRRQFGRVAGVTPKANVRPLFQSVCRLRGEGRLLAHIENWVERHGGAMALRKDKWAAKNFLEDCRTEFAVQDEMAGRGSTLSVVLPPSSAARVRNVEVPVSPDSVDTFEMFKAEFYKYAGITPAPFRKNMEMWAAAVGKHGLDAVLDLIPGWVEQHGGYETLATDKWAAGNFLNDVEVMLTVEVVRGRDTRSRDGSVDVRDDNTVSAQGQRIYEHFRRTK